MLLNNTDAKRFPAELTNAKTKVPGFLTHFCVSFAFKLSFNNDFNI